MTPLDYTYAALRFLLVPLSLVLLGAVIGILLVWLAAGVGEDKA